MVVRIDEADGDHPRMGTIRLDRTTGPPGRRRGGSEEVAAPAARRSGGSIETDGPHPRMVTIRLVDPNHQLFDSVVGSI
ncbi:hypothetical protein, partial [Prosthecodimorpha hirschii]|uniref:hypothetical protein n=1 Tax=Prosthecodimorpha hirschii TaxID=665126 RepID=UPI001AED37D4